MWTEVFFFEDKLACMWSKMWVGVVMYHVCVCMETALLYVCSGNSLEERQNFEHKKV